MKTYHCHLCPYKTGSRKDIRDHVRKVHGITGGTGHGTDTPISDISSAYHAEEGTEVKAK